MTVSSAVQSPLSKLKIDQLPGLLVGADTKVPTATGDRLYINFDNAASTPTFKPIADAVNEFLRWYSNVHRGTGFKSQLSSWAFERARDLVADFVGADLRRHVVIFTKNTTEAINKLGRRCPCGPDDIILTSLMEHHSNELPWRRAARVERIGLNADGTLSREDFQNKIRKFGDRIKLVALTGASNVTGYITDIDYFAREAHNIGARILIDGAQLIPHRPITMHDQDAENHIDFLVFSAHKMYAPFGTGVLVCDRELFQEGDPESVGGGVVDIVTLEEAYWTELPEKEEAGTPDIVGVVALGAAIQMFRAIGWDQIIRHEAELTAYALEKLDAIDGIDVYGDTDPATAESRLGVISMNVRDVPHALTAAILAHEGGIGVRSGCFCAHTYVKELLEVGDDAARRLELQILKRDRSEIPGTIRVSFGLYNTKAEIDHLVTMLQKIVDGDRRQDYVLNKEKGEYSPPDQDIDFSKYFRF